MKLFKGWTRWMLRSLLSIMLISSVTVFTTWTMIEIYMNRFLERAALTGEVGEVRISDLLAYIASGKTDTGPREGEGSSPIERITQQSDYSPLLRDEAGRREGESEEPLETGTDGSRAPGAEGDGDEEVQDAVPVFGNGGMAIGDEEVPSLDGGAEESQGDGTGQDELVMSADEFASKQDQLSEDDKMTIFTILFTKVPQHEFQNLSYLLEEGLTSREIKDIYDLLSEYLTEEEMQQLSSIIQKYE